MDLNNNYKEIVNLLNNIISDEKLRTNLTADEKFKEFFITQVNNLLSLEFDHSITFEEKKWAPIFGKSLVNITKEKIKFSKTTEINEDSLYADYTLFVNFIVKEYDFEIDKLKVESSISEENIKANSTVSDELKKTFLVGAFASPEPEIVDKEKEKPNTNGPQDQASFFSQNPNGIPIHPSKDPRFYPYKSKPKVVFYIKTLMSCMMFSIALLIVIFFIVGVSKPFDFGSENAEISGLFQGLKQFVNGEYQAIQGNVPLWNLFFNGLSSFGVRAIFLLGFFSLVLVICNVWPASILSKPAKSRADQYFLSWWTIVGISMFSVFTVSYFSQYLTEASIKNYFHSLFKMIFFRSDVEGSKYLLADFEADFEKFWVIFSGQSLFKAMSVIAIIAIVIISINLVLILCLVFVNPKLDMDKIRRSDLEYQKFLSEAMQGRKYEIDPTLFETDEFVPNKSWFSRKTKPKNDEETEKE